MVKKAGGESLAVDVYERLRADIFDRRLAPGERLKPVELGERFGVSISVMREALGLLAAQNLVRIERNRGFHVTTLSVDVLNDLIVARKINEGGALRLSVTLGGVAWESEALAAHHRLSSQPMYLPGEDRDGRMARNPEWAAAHIAFHHKLIEACGNAVLLDICDRLSDAAELYRAWSGGGAVTQDRDRAAGSDLVDDHRRDVAAEHKGLLDAALAHDADLAVDLFEAHVDRTASILLDATFAGTLPVDGFPVTGQTDAEAS